MNRTLNVPINKLNKTQLNGTPSSLLNNLNGLGSPSLVNNPLGFNAHKITAELALITTNLFNGFPRPLENIGCSI